MRVLISTSSFARFDRQPLEILESEGFDVRLNPYGRALKEEELIKLASDCIGVIAGTEKYDEGVLGRLSGLKVISRCGTGMDSVDVEAAKRVGVIVKRTPDAPTESVAELTLGLMLCTLRNISLMDRKLRAGEWRKLMGGLLSEKTVGIIGLGKIGLRVAELLAPFNVDIVGYDIVSDSPEFEKHKIKMAPLDKLLKESDLITLHMPYSKEVHHFIDGKRMEDMKQGAILINTSRGGLVDEGALYEFIKKGRLGGAALDTFENEPYSGPLRELDNVVLTPHVGSYAREARVRMEVEAVENLISALKEVKGR